MNFLYLFLSIVGESGGYVLDRINFKKNHIGFRPLLLLGFIGMAVFLIPYLLLSHQPEPTITATSIFLTALIIGFSFIGNVFDALSLKADNLSLREPLIDFYPILAGFVGFFFFPEERSPATLIAFIAGTLVIQWGMHRIKLRKLQRKGIGYLVLSVCFYAILPTLYYQTLDYFSPAYISAIRVVGIIVLVSLFLRPKSVRSFTPKRIGYCLASGASASVGAIAGLYAIQAYGVVLTMLFLMLAPALRYLASQFILREKVNRVEIISSLLLTLIVALAAFAK